MRARLALLFSFLLAPLVAGAAVPQSFAVQGVLRDSTGALQSTTVAVTVKLWNDPTATASSNLLGTPVSAQQVMAQSGLFTVPVPVDATLAASLAGASQVWLEITAGSDVADVGHAVGDVRGPHIRA